MMKICASLLALAILGTIVPRAPETPKGIVASYDTLADTILAAKKTETNLVRAILEHHLSAAEAAQKAGDSDGSSAHMALFANEGDHAVGGIRKRLIEGGHHHNSDGEAKGVYEAGFVLVTKDAKGKVMAASAAMRQAKSDDERAKAFAAFKATADELLKGK
jgi:hypothetical protein